MTPFEQAASSPRRRINLPFALPAWADRDNPLVVREMAALPNFLGEDGNMTVKVILFGLLALGLVSCSCSCGGFIWNVLLLPLYLMPMFWGCLIINRERATHNWDMLRTTPYSTREILLAKISAVVYRLAPVLTLILVGQVVVYLLTAAFSSLMYSSTYLSVNGTTQQFEDPFLMQTPLTVVLLFGISLLTLILSTLLTFFTNITIGGLASAMTERREFAYLGSIALRVAVSAGVLALAFGVALLVTGNLEEAAALFGLAGLGQGSIMLLAVPFNVFQLVVVTGFLVLAQTGTLVGLFRLTVWRANQP